MDKKGIVFAFQRCLCHWKEKLQYYDGYRQGRAMQGLYIFFAMAKKCGENHQKKEVSLVLAL
jgi:hypothetical protein